MTNNTTQNQLQESKFVLYSDDNSQIKIEVFVQDENIWLTQKRMAQLFDCTSDNIALHLKNIYSTAELNELSTAKKYSLVQKEGNRDVNRETNFYNLDAIISVGYRVNSTKATQFRIWATTQLKELIIKGFVLDDDKLKQAKSTFQQDYFRELLERVRSIRASERRVWLQITDIFKECSSDYNPKDDTAKEFFATIQNKFHYAITGHTAAEIIHQNANHTKLKMGLTTYKNSPNGRVLKLDTEIAKNYLSETEIKSLERSVSSFFDYIEGIIERQVDFGMLKFADSIDKFLSFNEFKILNGKGNISHDQALTKAHKEYDIFNKTQKIDSDFEKFIQKTKTLKN